ncbi:hypothetical protein AKO1_007996 [Acrasis kona]|uniref:RING-type domain-containing protein n=1 Tax=Acrasis kona TaxID=1008807 RepID=A0AAW2YSM1_9EUKA
MCGKSFDQELIESHASRCTGWDASSSIDIKQDIEMSDEDLARYYMEQDELEAKLQAQQREEEERLTLLLLEQENLNNRNENEHRFKSNSIQCNACGKDLVENLEVMDSCPHTFCKPCVKGHVTTKIAQNVSSIPCPISNMCEYISDSNLKSILTIEEFDNYADMRLKAALSENSNYVSCPNSSCRNVIEMVPSNTQTILDYLHRKNKRVPTAAEIDHERFRYRCRECTVEFCSQCRSTPYHEDQTCSEHKEYLESRHCRFCKTKIMHGLTCGQKQCMDLFRESCHKTLQCGHYCCGIRNERNCLPCLDEKCARRAGLTCDADSYCGVCYTDSLDAMPCIQLASCDHIFHLECIKRKITTKWIGARITFGFMNCPLCQVPIIHDSLVNTLRPFKEMKQLVLDGCENRLHHERLHTHEDITKPGGRFYKKPIAFALHNFAYYMCYECKKPYFGGMRRCEDENRGDGNSEFNEKELICGSCVAKKFKDSQRCNKHGVEFNEYKCKFCCNIATWFCWGNTHFCDECHKIQVASHKLTKTPKDQLPKCKGRGRCPSGGDHQDNGEEYALGCGICRTR